MRAALSAGKLYDPVEMQGKVMEARSRDNFLFKSFSLGAPHRDCVLAMSKNKMNDGTQTLHRNDKPL